MSDSGNAADGSSATNDATQTQKPPAEKPPTAVGDLPDEALRQRLQREREKGAAEARAAQLKSLGVENEDELKAALKDRQERLDAEKSQADKLADITARHAETSKRAQRYETIIKARATAELADLTDEQRAAVESLAGDDPAETLKAITALRPTWGKPATKDDAADEKPKPPPVDTAPSRNSAPNDDNTSPPDHKAVWEAMKAKNPIAAAGYYNSHKQQIFPSD